MFCKEIFPKRLKTFYFSFLNILLGKLNVKETFPNYHLRKMDGLLIEKDDNGSINWAKLEKFAHNLFLKLKKKKILTVLGTQITLFLLVIVLLSELAALNMLIHGLLLGILLEV